jgi:hypothetical protein
MDFHTHAGNDGMAGAAIIIQGLKVFIWETGRLSIF